MGAPAGLPARALRAPSPPFPPHQLHRLARRGQHSRAADEDSVDIKHKGRRPCRRGDVWRRSAEAPRSGRGRRAGAALRVLQGAGRGVRRERRGEGAQFQRSAERHRQAS
jgi:hypothetical protein